MDRKFQEAQEAILKGVGFEDSVAYLKSSGVFDHVSTLLMRLAAEKPKNALEVFENLSASVKVSGINFPAPQEAKKFDEARDAQKVCIGVSIWFFWILGVQLDCFVLVSEINPPHYYQVPASIATSESSTFIRLSITFRSSFNQSNRVSLSLRILKSAKTT